MKYTSASNVQSWLKNYKIDFATEYNLIDIFVQQAENEIEAYCNNVFNLRTLNEVISGSGKPILIAKRTPIFSIDRLAMRYGNQTIKLFTDGDGQIMTDRKVGKITITEFAQISGAIYKDIFAVGQQNVLLTYTTAYCFIGDNIGLDIIGRYGFNDVMRISQDATHFTFELPFKIGSVNFRMTRSGTADLSSYIDNTASWTLVGSRDRIRILIADYDSTAVYRLVYIPEAVETSATLLASANLLSSIAGRNDSRGGGGNASISVGGFSESYGGEGKYGAQIKLWRDLAMKGLMRFRAVGVSNV